MTVLYPKQTGLPSNVYIPRRGECKYCKYAWPHIHVENSKSATPIQSKAGTKKSGKTTKPVILKNSPVAKSLSNPAFRPQRVNSGKLYKRKDRKNDKIEDD